MNSYFDQIELLKDEKKALYKIARSKVVDPDFCDPDVLRTPERLEFVFLDRLTYMEKQYGIEIPKTGEIKSIRITKKAVRYIQYKRNAVFWSRFPTIIALIALILSILNSLHVF